MSNPKEVYVVRPLECPWQEEIDEKVIRPLVDTGLMNETNQVYLGEVTPTESRRCLQEQIPYKAHVVTAGGDSIVARVIGASAEGNREWNVGAMLIGKHNSMARRHTRGANAIDLVEASRLIVEPIRIEADGKYLCHALQRFRVGSSTYGNGLPAFTVNGKPYESNDGVLVTSDPDSVIYHGRSPRLTIRKDMAGKSAAAKLIDCLSSKITGDSASYFELTLPRKKLLSVTPDYASVPETVLAERLIAFKATQEDRVYILSPRV